MTEGTKATLLRNHGANELLNAPYLAQVPQSDLDFATDHPVTGLEPAVIESTIEAMESGQTHYVDVPGILPLREAVTAHLEGEGVDGYPASSIVVTASLQEARFLALQVITEALPEVALPEVVHPGVKAALGIRPPGLHYLTVERESGMLPPIDAIEQALERGVKLVYLESPARLTGAAFEPSSVERLAGLLESHDAYAIWDQGLSPFVSGSPYLSLGALAGMQERVTLIGEAFPGVGLEGLAIGTIATSERWAKPITSLKQIMSICTATASQYAALKAGEHFDTELGELLASLQVVRQESVEQLTAAGVHVHPGQVASLIALTISQELASSLRERGYRFADGADFGHPGVQRLSVTPGSDVVEMILSQLSEARS